MIDSDPVGNKKLEELYKLIDTGTFNFTEEGFISDLQYKGMRYGLLTNKQKNWIAMIYDAVMR